VTDRWAQWLLERRHGGDEAALAEMLSFLEPIRDRVLEDASIEAGDTVLDVGCGDGLIGFGALRQVGPGGRVIFSDVSQELLDRCVEIAGGDGRCSFVRASATDLGEVAGNSVDVVTVRSVLIYVDDRDAAFAEFFRVLRPGGHLSVFEPLNSFEYPGPADRWGPWDVAPVRELADRVKGVFTAIHDRAGNSMHDFGADDMAGWAERAGFSQVRVNATYELTPAQPSPSWDTDVHQAANPLVPSLAEAIDAVLDDEEAARFRAHLRAKAMAGDGVERGAYAHLRAVR
jgi:ubiquinone/menaquinone biosynthesis C-methylase UbiE